MFAFIFFVGLYITLASIQAPEWLVPAPQKPKAPSYHERTYLGSTVERDVRAMNARTEAALERERAATDKFGDISARKKKFMMGAK